MASRSENSTLEIDQRREGALSVVALRGEIDMKTSPRLREVFLGLTTAVTGRVVVDLGQVPYMDSSGIGTLVEFKRKAERRGAKVILASVQARVRSLFEITNLDKFFAMVDSVADAERV